MRTRRVYRLTAGAAVAAALVAVGPSAAGGTETDAPSDRHGTASALLRDVDGTVVGKVTLRGGDGGGTFVVAWAERLTPGFHGFHIHEVGECDPPFTSAGGHFSPGDADHGAHAGDMPPLLVQESGTAQLAFRTDRFSVGDLFDADGSAVIVHAAPDNFAHIPSRYVSAETGQPGPDAATRATGDAGARVACGVLKRWPPLDVRPGRPGSPDDPR
jgi:superoxide dismutase, Cu-Zn family